MYVGVCTFAILFVWFAVPETKAQRKPSEAASACTRDSGDLQGLLHGRDQEDPQDVQLGQETKSGARQSGQLAGSAGGLRR